MKKNKRKDQEQKETSRRLALKRETLQALDNPALLGGAQGGAQEGVNPILPTTCSGSTGTAC